MTELAGKLDLDSCPYCSVNRPNLTLATRFNTTSHSGRNPRTWGGYFCQNCGGVVLIAVPEGSRVAQEVFPAPLQPDPEVPETAREYLGQAMRSLHAPAGCIMLAGSSVDAMLKAKGKKEGSLYSRIDGAAKEHLITQEMSRWAHEVRLDANDQRHADENASLPTEEDARRCLDFCIALGKFLFVLPARVQRGLAEASRKSP